MPDVETYNVEDIASYHRVPVDQIEAQLVQGIKVEMEHTTNPDLAREIALDHLLEMPDYYTKLRGMEDGK
jgi:hypothetical protein